MTAEQTLILRVLADFLNKRDTVLDGDIDCRQMMYYSKIHQIDGILYHKCNGSLPADVVGELEKHYASVLFQYSNRVLLYGKVTSVLEENGIPFFTVKGLDIASLYPVPSLRTMGDCDIVVHSNDRPAVHELMLGMGFEIGQQLGMEWIYCKNGFEFEIHDRLLYDEVGNSRADQDFSKLAWDYARGDGAKKQLDDSYHFVFLLLHLKKHILHSGAGLRQFMDLVVMVQNRPLDLEWISRTLDSLGILKFAQVCMTLCERWFDVKMPMNTDIDDGFFETATDKIFANGVFGFDDEDNRDNANLTKLKRSGKFRTVLSRIFPPYKSFLYVEYYSFVKGRPWLLPVAWIYRFYRGIRYSMGDKGRKLISSAVNSDEKLKEREQSLQKWGL